MSKLLFFDLETTGLDSQKCAIHQLAGYVVINGEIKQEFNYHIKPFPNALIDDKALEICKVGMPDLIKYPNHVDVYKEFTKLIGKYIDKFNKLDKFHLVGYNNRRFDDEFLRNFFYLNGDKYFGSYFWADSIDVLVLASFLLQDYREKLPDFKLATITKALKLVEEDDNFHNAFTDIKNTMKIYDFFKTKLCL